MIHGLETTDILNPPKKIPEVARFEAKWEDELAIVEEVVVIEAFSRCQNA